MVFSQIAVNSGFVSAFVVGEERTSWKEGKERLTNKMAYTFKPINSQERVAVNELLKRVGDLKVSYSPEYFLHELNMVRFIRARNMNVDKAEAMYRKCVAWLEHVEFSKALTFVVRQEVVDNFKWSICGIDNLGGPVVSVPIGEWDPIRAHDVTCEELVKLALRSLAQICGVAIKQHEDKGIAVQATGIADMKGLGMKHVTHMEGIKATLTMVRYFEANFPEYLRVVFVLNAPYAFSIAWRLVKPLITGTTHQKIRFVYNNIEKEIGSFVGPDQLPVKYGGTLAEDSVIICDGQDFRRVSSNGNCEDAVRIGGWSSSKLCSM